ncbi:NAD/NADP octopine/nopaline dehydrogenase family protein [Irregularibacter muris]|uniref:NAD/NADP octopine/nopaline dehydrogenase family protein n=1 Tax=Irregularibacter muris TaxID=1796619 RepID=A0AAE3HFP3_9FIRM|nr:NAD/NADP-dependent octopine/nopaline dehydrogenase family protein [Irregularibacter muris]MCR1898599.1 NAD/NADP octopine/nopaline dehydrogenase family protein [Irregularibacter muris]
MSRKIAILGAGNGGYATAAHQALNGHQVNLWSRSDKNLKPILEKKGITIHGEAGEGFARLNYVSTDIGQVIKGVEVIFIVLPSFAVESVVEKCIPYLEDGQIMVLNLASTGTALRINEILKKYHVNKKIYITEFSSLTYGCRINKPGEVTVQLLAKNIKCANFPSKDNEKIYPILKEFYPDLVLAENVLETSLNNGNPVTHPAPSLLNAGRIEYSDGEFYLYTEGITPSVVKVIEAVDGERIQICRQFGFEEIPVEKRLARIGYTDKAESLYKQYSKSDVFSQMKGPGSLQNRYITEDIPYGLVVWASLAKTIGAQTHNMDSIITLASSLLNRDLWYEGWTIDKLGLEGMNFEEIQQYLFTGEPFGNFEYSA